MKKHIDIHIANPNTETLDVVTFTDFSSDAICVLAEWYPILQERFERDVAQYFDFDFDKKLFESRATGKFYTFNELIWQWWKINPWRSEERRALMNSL